jgi:hypothetical protein
MAIFPLSPRVMKGALVGIDIFNPLASIIIFQYNPETMTRSLQAQTLGGNEGDKTEALRLKGAPIENITLDVEIDATDQLEKGDAIAGSLGIYPQLSALEMLIYPKSSVVIANTVLMAIGTIEVVPPVAPFTLFVWGPKRVLPVRITNFSITEEAYDVNLNPIRAKVSLGLRVLTYSDLSITHPGYHVFLAHQVVKETMAAIGSLNGVGGAAEGSLSFDVKLGV